MASWQTPVGPITVEFAPDKLDEIRIAVVDAFYAVPRGGVEIGGVLFGSQEEGRLLIRDYRKIETEYLTGPSFRLSENDLKSLRTLLAETKFRDPEIRPLGWFLSHTRGGIHLSKRDLDLYERFFPEPWQVALVLKPENLGKVRGGYFFRQADGSVNADTSTTEFILAPHFGEKQPSPELAVAEEKIEAPILQEESPVKSSVPIESDPGLFRFYTQTPAWSVKKRSFVIILSLASIAAAVAGYWVAIR
jgi:hypothetical protein